MDVTPNVLVVDDVAAMRDIIGRQLREMKFSSVLNASNGQDALRLMETKPVGLILSDWSMPGMSGLELLREVRRHPKLKSLPFVMITAELQRERVRQAVEAGVDEFLVKPFSPAMFSEKIRRVLTQRRRSPQIAVVEDVPAPPAPSDLDKPTVLVVDDTPDNLTLVSGLLENDYQVKVATRGDKALKICETAPPDLILLDIMMPEMDGFEVCRRLKADLATASIPVIFLTALNDVASTVKGLGLGAVDYVAKPIEPAILKARVASSLRLFQAHEALRQQYDLLIDNARLRDDVEQITRHDLKNPLSAILGMVSALQSDSHLTQEQTQQIKGIEQATYDVLHMVHLSADLLLMEQGKYRLKPQPVDLVNLITRVAEESRQAFAGKRITLLTHFPELVEGILITLPGEPLLLYSLLHNLVKNAAEAVQEGETVLVTLYDGEPLVITVHNPGLVAAEIHDRFFEKFVTHGKEGGTGLGTYSAKLFVEAHGGRIDMESQAEKGVTLSLAFPKRD
ncbi:MAG: response regulator [Pseudomonadota bacterium]